MNLITVKDLSFHYHNENGRNDTKIKKNTSHNDLIHKANFEISSHDFIALLGPNGAGKTTLVKIILGNLTPTEGNVTTYIPRTKIGYTPQNYQISELFPGTVEELLYFNPAHYSPRSGTSTNTANNTNSHADISNILNIYEALGIESIMKHRFIDLSGGYRQRVLIALALQNNPHLLILDEPTAGIDVAQQQSFYELLAKLNKTGIAILLVTHEVGIINNLVKKVLCINHQLCCMASPDQIPKLLTDMYGTNFSVHHHNHH